MDKKLISKDEVMKKLGITSRQTLWDYEKRRKFPRPVKLRPKAYLRKDFYKWIEDGGVSQLSS
ncbi:MULTISPECIES: helix-turn-helix transcriptional regulator [Xenorhabdus]|uniref:helix-turn-helix transcriptional regulator n=1 Tax=Xenorhabdus TaxID=626 RepID=UPI00064A9410|nr:MULTISPECIES: AlpA family phage regulatory protein [Xenorhabdus]KLU15583.1 AlpA family transcriptional regulator [Xenorhabdus griffiniae]KOP33873.1 AlpA family transcriptional regulator [Xenorhabdus sp. GDc328]